MEGREEEEWGRREREGGRRRERGGERRREREGAFPRFDCSSNCQEHIIQGLLMR